MTDFNVEVQGSDDDELELILSVPARYVKQRFYLGDGEVLTDVVVSTVTAAVLRARLHEVLVSRGVISE